MVSFGEDFDAKRYRDWIAPYLGAGSASEL
jgi:hypothetical protein